MTTNVNNQAIAHLGFRAGAEPFCKSRRAHIVAAVADRAKWPRICARCAAKADKRKPTKFVGGTEAAFRAEGL